MVWSFIFGILIIFYVNRNHAQIPRSKFSCKGRSSGYYADVESGCQVYHMCDGLGRQFSYSCPNATLFQQRMLICDHWYMVNCSKSEDNYSANLLIGQQGIPFVDDTDKNPFRRTPRPDLLSHPSDTEYNIIYRTGGQDKVVSNLIGAETEDNPNSATEEATYSVPSHWSTEFSQQPPTARPKTKAIDFNNNNNNNRNSFDSAAKSRDKPYSAVTVNFKSNYKATTPVYPKIVESTSPIPDDLGILPPLPIKEDKLNSYESTFQATTPDYPRTVASTSIAPEDLGILPPKLQKTDTIPVNFESNFKATTPVYPKSVESTSIPPDSLGVQPPLNETPENVQKNFESNFKATTPVYPRLVENTSPEPGDLGILPPKDDQKLPENVKINFESTFKATTPNYPQIVESTSAEPGDLGILPPLSDRNRIETGNSNGNIQVNFESNYKATTPVYPRIVEGTSLEPNDLGVLPPFHTKLGPIVNGNLNSVPSQYYEPPAVGPDYKNPDEAQQQQQQRRIDFGDYNNEQWEILRKKFLIPDYDFPLEAVSRPSYDSDLSSFHVNPMPE